MDSTIQQSNQDMENPSLTELFHRVNSVIPDDQQLITVEPEMAVADAIELISKHSFSQVPVVVGQEVLGLFSHKTFSENIIRQSRAATKNRKFDPMELTVEDCMDEKPSFARITDEFAQWFDEIDQKDAILVGSPDRLLGIVTAVDILRYLYEVASPFVLLGEVELALRALMSIAVDQETLSACANECLKEKYTKDDIPTELHKMTFNDYIQIVGDGRRWPHFEPYFGGDRRRTRAKLEQLCHIRNVIFHFKREITVDEHQTLVSHRDWMLRKARTAEARQREAG